jgi:hypothetical protein
MRTAKPAELPKDLLRAQRRLLTWRSRHPARRPIPHSLWSLAVRLVERYGLHRTARTLKLDYYSLKKPGPAESCACAARPACLRRTAAAGRADNVLDSAHIHLAVSCVVGRE